MSQLEFVQLHNEYGRQAFSALSTAFCYNPELAEKTSGLLFPGHPIYFLSLDRSYPLQVYQGDRPVLLMSLSECESLVHVLQRQDILTVLCQRQFPLIQFLANRASAEMNDLVECLCYQEEFLSEAIEEHVEDFKNYFVYLLTKISGFEVAEAALATLFDDIRCQRVIRSIFFQELRFIEMRNNRGFFLQFLQRFSRAPGSVTALVKGTPFMLGKGEYLVVGASFDEMLAGMRECTDQELIASMAAERVQATVCKVGSAVLGVAQGENNQSFYQVSDGKTTFKALYYSGEGTEFYAVASEQFPASTYYLFANCGYISIDGKKALVPGQYLLRGGEKLEGVCETGMLDQKTPCFILIGID